MKNLLVTILAIIAVILIVSESESIGTLLLTKVIGFAIAYAAYELYNLRVWKNETPHNRASTT